MSFNEIEDGREPRDNNLFAALMEYQETIPTEALLINSITNSNDSSQNLTTMEGLDSS